MPRKVSGTAVDLTIPAIDHALTMAARDLHTKADAELMAKRWAWIDQCLDTRLTLMR